MRTLQHRLWDRSKPANALFDIFSPARLYSSKLQRRCLPLIWESNVFSAQRSAAPQQGTETGTFSRSRSRPTAIYLAVSTLRGKSIIMVVIISISSHIAIFHRILYQRLLNSSSSSHLIWCDEHYQSEANFHAQRELYICCSCGSSGDDDRPGSAAHIRQ